MADQPTALTGQEPTGATEQPQAGTAPGQAPGAPKQLSDADLQAALKSARDEAADYRTRLRKFEKAEADAEAKRLEAAGEHQKLAEKYQQERDQANDRYRAALLEAKVASKAAELGVKNVKRLMQMVKDEVEYDEAGTPTNLDTLVQAALADVPGLVAQEAAKGLPPSGGPTNPGKQQPTKDLPTIQKRWGLGSPNVWKES